MKISSSVPLQGFARFRSRVELVSDTADHHLLTVFDNEGERREATVCLTSADLRRLAKAIATLLAEAA
jgi:peptide methionine sulfoxide reductase MsrB